jgi:hypothetical protein
MIEVTVDIKVQETGLSVRDQVQVQGQLQLA